MTNMAPAPSIKDNNLVWANQTIEVNPDTPVGRLIHRVVDEYDQISAQLVHAANSLATAANELALQVAIGQGHDRPQGIEHRIFELHADRQSKAKEITRLVWLLRQEATT